MPYRVIHVGTPSTRAMVIYIWNHLKQWDPTIDLPVVLDLCPLFSSTSVFLKKVRQHWKKKQKPKAIVRKEFYNSSLPHKMPLNMMFEIFSLSPFKKIHKKNIETSHVQRECLNFLCLCLWHQGIQRFTKPWPLELPIFIAMSSTVEGTWFSYTYFTCTIGPKYHFIPYHWK